MTDLTGAELDAAVAAAIGKQPQLLPDVKGVLHCMVPYPQDCAPDAMVAFRPSRGGAAAWEVLEWVRQQGWDVGLRCVELCLDSDEPVTESALCTLRATRPVRECQATGPTDAIALCRAVVALGEAL